MLYNNAYNNKLRSKVNRMYKDGALFNGDIGFNKLGHDVSHTQPIGFGTKGDSLLNKGHKYNYYASFKDELKGGVFPPGYRYQEEYDDKMHMENIHLQNENEIEKLNNMIEVCDKKIKKYKDIENNINKNFEEQREARNERNKEEGYKKTIEISLEKLLEKNKKIAMLNQQIDDYYNEIKKKDSAGKTIHPIRRFFLKENKIIQSHELGLGKGGSAPNTSLTDEIGIMDDGEVYHKQGGGVGSAKLNKKYEDPNLKQLDGGVILNNPTKYAMPSMKGGAILNNPTKYAMPSIVGGSNNLKTENIPPKKSQKIYRPMSKKDELAKKNARDKIPISSFNMGLSNETKGKGKVPKLGRCASKKGGKKCGGDIFGDIWSGVKDVANTAAPFVPLLLAAGSPKVSIDNKKKSSDKGISKKVNKWVDFVKHIHGSGKFKTLKETIKHIKDNNLYKK